MMRSSQPLTGPVMLLAMLALALCAPASAQSGGDFEIVRATVDGGGSTERSAGDILLRGTIGQPDAGASYKGIYYLKSGFWSTQGRLGIFFIDGFESGDTSAWSSTVGRSGGTSASSSIGSPKADADSPFETKESAAGDIEHAESTSSPSVTR